LRSDEHKYIIQIFGKKTIPDSRSVSGSVELVSSLHYEDSALRIWEITTQIIAMSASQPRFADTTLKTKDGIFPSLNKKRKCEEP
jgi:hypothetical protein